MKPVSPVWTPLLLVGLLFLPAALANPEPPEDLLERAALVLVDPARGAELLADPDQALSEEEWTRAQSQLEALAQQSGQSPTLASVLGLIQQERTLWYNRRRALEEQLQAKGFSRQLVPAVQVTSRRHQVELQEAFFEGSRADLILLWRGAPGELAAAMDVLGQGMPGYEVTDWRLDELAPQDGNPPAYLVAAALEPPRPQRRVDRRVQLLRAGLAKASVARELTAPLAWPRLQKEATSLSATRQMVLDRLKPRTATDREQGLARLTTQLEAACNPQVGIGFGPEPTFSPQGGQGIEPILCWVELEGPLDRLLEAGRKLLQAPQLALRVDAAEVWRTPQATYRLRLRLEFLVFDPEMQ